MKKSHTYHLFLLLSTFTRGLVETFSLVLLYKKGFIIEEILLFLLFLGRTFNLKIGIREIVAKTIKIILTNKRDNLDIIKTPTIEDKIIPKFIIFTKFLVSFFFIIINPK